MSSKTFLLIIFFLIVAGLIAYGYFNAVSSPNKEAGNSPLIEINPDFFDFGEVAYGEIAEHTFKLKNSGSGLLEIRKVATSCGCTTAEVEKEAINPGEEINLLVKYDTGAMSGSHAKGNQERIIYIKSNDPANPQIEAVIRAYVR